MIWKSVSRPLYHVHFKVIHTHSRHKFRYQQCPHENNKTETSSCPLTHELPSRHRNIFTYIIYILPYCRYCIFIISTLWNLIMDGHFRDLSCLICISIACILRICLFDTMVLFESLQRQLDIIVLISKTGSQASKFPWSTLCCKMP